MQIKALACELPHEQGLPLSRFSGQDLVREATRRGLLSSISGRTIWRWLDEDAIRPWQHRSWIFPRDPDFQIKAEWVLDLYQGSWNDQALGAEDYVVSADEKTSIQARLRLHPTLPPQPRQAMRVEFEYERGGARAYLAAWDVRRAKVFGRCEATTGIEPFGRLVQQVMEQEPYRHAQRVFWIVDNGSSHRGTAAVQRLQGAYSNLIVACREHIGQPDSCLAATDAAEGCRAAGQFQRRARGKDGGSVPLGGAGEQSALAAKRRGELQGEGSRRV